MCKRRDSDTSDDISVGIEEYIQATLEEASPSNTSTEDATHAKEEDVMQVKEEDEEDHYYRVEVCGLSL